MSDDTGHGEQSSSEWVKAFIARREALDNQMCEVTWYAEYYEQSLGRRTRMQLREEIERRILRTSDELEETTSILWQIKDSGGCSRRTYKLATCNPGDDSTK